jgi:PadR family transcriptional regulator PadR
MYRYNLENKLLIAWEDVYKKGQLTLWVFLSLVDSPKAMADIKEFIASSTNGVISADEQSLYRALRRYTKAELIEFKEQEVRKGPNRKVYSLTPLGTQVTRAFLERNIVKPFYNKSVSKMITNYVRNN